MTDYLDGMVTAFAGPPVTEPRKAQRCKIERRDECRRKRDE